MILGKTVDEALQLTNKAVADALGGLPPVKMHCSLLAEEAVKAAILDYKKRRGLFIDDSLAVCEGCCDACYHKQDDEEVHEE